MYKCIFRAKANRACNENCGICGTERMLYMSTTCPLEGAKMLKLLISLTKSSLEPSLRVLSFSSKPCRRDQAVLDAPERITKGLCRMLSYISCVSLL